MFLRCSKILVGEGTDINFWQDEWCLDVSLKEIFPMLYELDCNKNGRIADVRR